MITEDSTWSPFLDITRWHSVNLQVFSPDCYIALSSDICDWDTFIEMCSQLRAGIRLPRKTYDWIIGMSGCPDFEENLKGLVFCGHDRESAWIVQEHYLRCCAPLPTSAPLHTSKRMKLLF